MALDTTAAVMLELMTMGQQSAAHLGELLTAASPTMAAEHGQALTAEIVRCCDRVIAAISRAGKKRKVMDVDRGAMRPSKRRARGAEAHREVHASGTTADGFVWRKYGQKDINGSKHPRFYYRCAYSAEGCPATRRVQQSQEEPAAFVIAYYGEHTCGGGDVAARCQQGAAPVPPAVVGFASDAREGAIDRYRNGDSSPQPPLVVAEQGRHLHCQEPGGTSRGQWSSSSSSSSEVELGNSPVLEFLDGSLGWESVANYLGFSDLPQIPMPQ